MDGLRQQAHAPNLMRPRSGLRLGTEHPLQRPVPSRATLSVTPIRQSEQDMDVGHEAAYEKLLRPVEDAGGAA